MRVFGLNEEEISLRERNPSVCHRGRQIVPARLARHARSIKIAWLLVVSLGILVVALSDAHGQLFEADSKQFGSSKMDIVLKEVERRPRASVVEIKINSVGSSVGSSFFILCSIRRLAQLRGPYRYIVKLEEQPKRNQMLVGFLSGPAESPASAGPEFSRAHREAVIDLEQFAPICDGMK